MSHSIAKWLALKFVPKLNIQRKLALVEEYGLAKLFQLTNAQLALIGLTEHQQLALTSPNWQYIEFIIQSAEQQNVDIIVFDSPEYPQLLREIADPPLVLFAKGNSKLLSQPQVAIVGSRFATPMGREHAFQFAKELSHLGITVTSGLATGIDAVAHRGAITAKGNTVAVIATGIDIVYPASNRQLNHAILENNGCILTEFLFGIPPKKDHFPRRNRLISGLSLGTLVVEAALKSGSLITARLAMEQNREVFALPGSINSTQSKGCHYLIKQGAKLVESIDDIVEELGFRVELLNMTDSNQKSEKSCQQDLFIDPLLASVGYETTAIDLVVSRSKLPIDVVLTKLTMLELNGLVSAVPGGYLRVNRG